MQAVAKSGSAEVIAVLVRAVGDEDQKVRLAAIEALKGLAAKGDAWQLEGHIRAGTFATPQHMRLNRKVRHHFCSECLD